MRNTLKVLSAVGMLMVALYLLDWIALELPIPKGRTQFSEVHVQPLLAVPKKDGKTEFILDDPFDQRCANSLFPHFSTAPCWYVRRHTHPRKDM